MINSLTVELNRLCDKTPNPKRTNQDLFKLYNILAQSPKECIPYKGQILQTINLNASRLNHLDLKLTSAIYARATILFRGSENKSCGPLAGWITNFSNQLGSLEHILDKLYSIIGVKCPDVLTKLSDEDSTIPSKTISEDSDYKTIIDEYIHLCEVHVHNICALINITSNFDLPIPVIVLLRLCSKICAIRAKDVKSSTKGALKSYIYSKTDQLIRISMLLTTNLIDVLQNDIIPFMPMLNMNLRRLFQWAKTFQSDDIRVKMLEMTTCNLDEFSLNANIEPIFIEELIADSLEVIKQRKPYTIIAINCLERIILTYSDGYLSANLHAIIKRSVIQVCLDTYVNSSPISVECRRALIQLLLTTMSQLHATTTTEVGTHLLSLVDTLETDPDIKLVIRRGFKVGFTHRPIIVSYEDVISSNQINDFEVQQQSMDPRHTQQIQLEEHEQMQTEDAQTAQGETDKSTTTLSTTTKTSEVTVTLDQHGSGQESNKMNDVIEKDKQQDQTLSEPPQQQRPPDAELEETNQSQEPKQKLTEQAKQQSQQHVKDGGEEEEDCLEYFIEKFI